MNKLRILRDMQGHFYGVAFTCPGCDSAHVLPVTPLPPGETESPHAQGKPHWSWNGSREQPTLSPSIKASDRPGGTVCHLFVTEGDLVFCADSTHKLAGQTVPMAEQPLEESEG